MAVGNQAGFGIKPVVAGGPRKRVQQRQGAARRELEHDAKSDSGWRRAAKLRRPKEIAAAIGNEAGEGKSPVAARKSVQHLIGGPARRELEHRAASAGRERDSEASQRPAAKPCRPIDIAAAADNHPGEGLSPVAGGPRKRVQHLIVCPARRELEHRAASGCAASGRADSYPCRPIKIAAAADNRPGEGLSPVAGGPRKRVQDRQGRSGRGGAARRDAQGQRGAKRRNPSRA